jgi:hypothetical protein
VLGLSQLELGTVKELCEFFLQHLETWEKTEKGQLLAVIRALPLNEVLEAKSSPLLSPATARVDKRRSRP